MATSKKETLDAKAIIEKFGGIRPMAKLLNITASTVQGWNERNKIPEKRYADILKIAKKNNIDLSETKTLSKPTAEKKQPAQKKETAKEQIIQEKKADIKIPPSSEVSHERKTEVRSENMQKSKQEPKSKAKKRSPSYLTKILLIIIIVLIGAFAYYIYETNKTQSAFHAGEREKLTVLTNKMNQIDHRLEQLKAIQETINFEALKKDFEANKASVSEIQTVTNELQKSFDNISSKVEKIQESKGTALLDEALKKDFEDIKKKVSDVEAVFETYKNEVSTHFQQNDHYLLSGAGHDLHVSILVGLPFGLEYSNFVSLAKENPELIELVKPLEDQKETGIPSLAELIKSLHEIIEGFKAVQETEVEEKQEETTMRDSFFSQIGKVIKISDVKKGANKLSNQDDLDLIIIELNKGNYEKVKVLALKILKDNPYPPLDAWVSGLDQHMQAQEILKSLRLKIMDMTVENNKDKN